MELPSLGQHCSESSCKHLDFLPMKCDACQNIYCGSHIMYEQHRCPESYKRNNQVPVCPLCNMPIPVKPGTTADIVVGRHIDSDCQSDPAKERRKVYANKCANKGCKTKELIPFKCDRCHKNYCVRHRLEADHACQGFQNSGMGVSRAGAAAVTRNQAGSSRAATASKPKAKPQQTQLSHLGLDLDRDRQARQQQQGQRVTASHVHGLQGSTSDDEAMARAVAMSLSDNTTSRPQQTSTPQDDAARKTQEEEDLALAQALAASEGYAQQPQASQRQQKEKSCQVS